MPIWNRKWEVTSFTDPSKKYVVSAGTTRVGEKKLECYGCSCPSWRFKKVDPLTGARPHCKHILATFGQIKLEKKIAIEEETRLLLDQWAVVELTSLPKMEMMFFEERSI